LSIQQEKRGNIRRQGRGEKKKGSPTFLGGAEGGKRTQGQRVFTTVHSEGGRGKRGGGDRSLSGGGVLFYLRKDNYFSRGGCLGSRREGRRGTTKRRKCFFIYLEKEKGRLPLSKRAVIFPTRKGGGKRGTPVG